MSLEEAINGESGKQLCWVRCVFEGNEWKVVFKSLTKISTNTLISLFGEAACSAFLGRTVSFEV